MKLDQGRKEKVFSGHIWSVFCIKMSQKSRYLASELEDKKVRIRSLNEVKEVNFLGIARNRRYLVTGLYYKTLRVIDPEAGNKETVLTCHYDTV